MPATGPVRKIWEKGNSPMNEMLLANLCLVYKT